MKDLGTTNVFRNEAGSVTVVVPDWVLDTMQIADELGHQETRDMIWNFFAERHPDMSCLMPRSKYEELRNR